MSRFDYLVDLVEDTRHAAMQLRRMLKPGDIPNLTATTETLVAAAQRVDESALGKQEAKDIRGAAYLQHRFEEDITYLLHLDNV